MTETSTVAGTGNTGLQADRAFCEQVLPAVSRTFALSISMLPQELREPIRVAYLLCRIVDTIEDDTTTPIELRREMFAEFDLLMAEDSRSTGVFERMSAVFDASLAERELCMRAGATFRCYRALPADQRAAICPSVLRMSEGMQEYAERMLEAPLSSIADVADLERYCYFVAGTVGELLTPLFELSCGGLPKELRQQISSRAVSFGLGLQLVNIVKDVADDFSRGICFLPRALLVEHGIPLEQLLEPEYRAAGLQVVGELCRVAREHLLNAREYTLLWPPDAREVRLFCAVPLILALATLNLVDSEHYTLRVGQNPKVSREFVKNTLMESRFVIEDDPKLSALFEQAAAYQHPSAD